MFCANCGFKLEEDSLFCPNCGAKVKDQEIVETPVPETEVIPEKKASIPHIPNIPGLKVETADDYVNKKIKEAQGEEGEIPKKKKRPAKQVFTLWSWLKKDETREMFFEEQESDISEKDYMSTLSDKISENKVPAEIKNKSLFWDDSEEQNETYVINPITDCANPLSFLIQFKHVGKFTFVEEKTFITPPDLPEVPGKPVPEDQGLLKRMGYLVPGAIALLFGIILAMQDSYSGTSAIQTFGYMLLFTGIILIGLAIDAGNKLKKIREYNAKCAAQLKAWNQAWDDWEETSFRYSFQETTNGELSRIFESVKGCIKQVNKEIFGEKKAVEEEKTNMNELEQMIARRRDDLR